jgi:signal transduction histidine kinase
MGDRRRTCFTMRYAGQILSFLLLVVVAAVVFHFFQKRLSDAAFMFTVNPDVLEQLEQSLDDQRLLAQVNPENRHEYRQRFDELQKTVHRLKIIAHSRDNIVERYETIVLVAFGAIVFAVTAVSLIRHLRLQPRLARLQTAIAALASGRTDLEVGVRGRDPVGRIAAMIEKTSRVMARDRQRIATLKNLSTWQEAARRQAHEMRTPLTGARLEIEKIHDLTRGEFANNLDALKIAAVGALEELDRLGSFTRRFTSFARLPQPKLETVTLESVLERFVASYSNAWSNVCLSLATDKDLLVCVDEEMLRQVLANLCDNSSRAVSPNSGAVSISAIRHREIVVIEVADNGPGVADSVLDRLFEPYATTRNVGDGMGLGLAICKKVMLEHGGDLELAQTSPQGTTMRLTIPLPTIKDVPK